MAWGGAQPVRCRWPAICWIAAIEEWRSQAQGNPRLADAVCHDTRWLAERPEILAAAGSLSW